MALPVSPQATLSRVDAVVAPSFQRRFGPRIFLYIIALSLATSAASAGVYYWRQLGFIDRERAHLATTLLGGLATQSELCAYAIDPLLCEPGVRRAFTEEDVAFVAVYDRNGKELIRLFRGHAPSLPPRDVLHRLLGTPEGKQGNLRVAEADGADTGYDEQYAPILTLTRDPAEALAGGPAGSNARKEVVGVARIGISLRPGREQLRELMRWGLLLAAGILALGTVAAYLITRRVSLPIGELIAGAERIRRGDLDTRVRVETQDELGQLAYSFNRMARRLNDGISALETLNRDLEAEVARRTAEVQRAADFSALLNAPLGPGSERAPGAAGERSTEKTTALDPATTVRTSGRGWSMPARGPAEGVLGRVLDEALVALVYGTGARAGAALLVDEGPAEEGKGKKVSLARCVASVPEDFEPPPPLEFLDVGALFLDGRHTVVPLLLGAEVQGCVVLVDLPQRPDLLRFVAQAASQLAIGVSNVRNYAAADRLTRALQERNAALAKQRDELQEMNRLKSEFLANISHELRTPLNAIIGYSELISEGIYGEVTADQTSALSGIDESGHNLLNLINQILDLAKVESGKMTVDAAPVDVLEVTRGVVAEAAALAKDRPYKVELTTESLSPFVTDGTKVKQIVTNLVSNAVKFTAQGSVEVAVRALDGGGCTIAVKDTGIGIKPGDMKIIFEEFRQVDGSYTREFGGTGLGLAIAARFAHMLGGEITVDSTLGIGSTFTLSLPASLPASLPINPPMVTEAKPS